MHARGKGMLALGADVDLAGRVVAHQHHRQAWLQAVLGLQPRHLLGHLGAQALGVDLAVDDLGWAHGDSRNWRPD